MVDGENIAQEDLVVFFNLGGHHVPTSGDVPNTLMHTSASSVMFVPWNWGESDLSRETVSGVRVGREVGEGENNNNNNNQNKKKKEKEEKNGTKRKVKYFGGRYELEDHEKGVFVGREGLEPDVSWYGRKEEEEEEETTTSEEAAETEGNHAPDASSSSTSKKIINLNSAGRGGLATLQLWNGLLMMGRMGLN